MTELNLYRPRSNAGAELRGITIEALLIWTYRDQQADQGSGVTLFEAEQRDGRQWRQESGRGVALLGRSRAPGLRLPAAAKLRTGAAHPDARIVHLLVNALPDREIAGLVIRCGRTALRPNWRPGEERTGIAAPPAVYGRWRETLAALLATLRRHPDCLASVTLTGTLPPWDGSDRSG